MVSEVDNEMFHTLEENGDDWIYLKFRCRYQNKVKYLKGPVEDPRIS